MSLQAKIEAIIYAAEEPVTLAQLLTLLTPDLEQALAEQDAAQPELPAMDAPAEELSSEGVAESGENSAESAQNEPEKDEKEPLLVDEKKLQQQQERRLRDYLKAELNMLLSQYDDRGVYISEVASGYRMSTRPEYHDVIRDFAKSLKPPLKLSLPALETLAVIAYKQPVTAAEVGEIRGVDSAGVLGGLMTRKLITTAGRKQVIGRPILYKTTKEFLLRFGLKDVSELPSIEEFEKMAGELAEQEDLPMETPQNHEVEPTFEPESGSAEEPAQNEGDVEPNFATGDPAEDVAAKDTEETGEIPQEDFADVRRKPEDVENQ